MRFNKVIHNILVERGIASENTVMLFMCFHGAIRQTNMATDSFNIYLSPVGVKSLNRFVINWQAVVKLIRHAHEYNGFVTLNASTIKNVMTCLKGTRGYGAPGYCKARADLQKWLSTKVELFRQFSLDCPLNFKYPIYEDKTSSIVGIEAREMVGT